MHPYEHLSREERIRRIGDILAKGIYLMALRDQVKNTAVVDVAARVEVPDSDWIAHGIVGFLQRVGWAAPREIRRNLDIAPRTCARRLRSLVARGRTGESWVHEWSAVSDSRYSGVLIV